VLGTLFHYLVRVDENTVRFKELLKAVESYTRSNRLPPAVASRIRAHFEFQHRHSSSSTNSVFEQLPPSLRTQVASEQYLKEMQATWVFHACTPQFLDQIVLELRERYVMPSEPIFFQGEGSTELLWCIGGTLQVKKDGELVSTILSALGAGQIVGELAFFLGIHQPYTVMASSAGFATLLELTVLDYEEIISSYPEHADAITSTVLRKFGLDKCGNDIMQASALDVEVKTSSRSSPPAGARSKRHYSWLH
jgi:CRP-like cAMP-binding protein